MGGMGGRDGREGIAKSAHMHMPGN
jgi:hypothetical protein